MNVCNPCVRFNESEISLILHPSRYPTPLRQKRERKRIKLRKNLKPSTDVAKLAGEVMKKCKYVHASKRDDLERVIQELQHQVREFDAAFMFFLSTTHSPVHPLADTASRVYCGCPDQSRRADEETVTYYFTEAESRGSHGNTSSFKLIFFRISTSKRNRPKPPCIGSVPRSSLSQSSANLPPTNVTNLPAFNCLLRVRSFEMIFGQARELTGATGCAAAAALVATIRWMAKRSRRRPKWTT